jgi:hypothetical protein
MRNFGSIVMTLFFLTVSLHDNTFNVLMYHQCGKKDNSANGDAGISHRSAKLVLELELELTQLLFSFKMVTD